MVMASFAEQESSLQGENIEEPASGSASQISGSLYWKFFHRESYDLYLTTVFPLLGSADNSLVSGGLGAEWYFSRENHRLKESSEGFRLSVDPKLRYYLIGEVNVVYLSYLTETSEEKRCEYRAWCRRGAFLFFWRQFGRLGIASLSSGRKGSWSYYLDF